MQVSLHDLASEVDDLRARLAAAEAALAARPRADTSNMVVEPGACVVREFVCVCVCLCLPVCVEEFPLCG